MSDSEKAKLREQFDSFNFRIGGDGWLPEERRREEERILRWAEVALLRRAIEEAEEIRRNIQAFHNDAIGKYFEKHIAALKAELEKLEGNLDG